MKLLNTFKHYGYSNQIGPGVYDIHSPRVPGEQEIKDRIAEMLNITSELHSHTFVHPQSSTLEPGATSDADSSSNPVSIVRPQHLLQPGVNYRWSPIVLEGRTTLEGDTTAEKNPYGQDSGRLRAGDRAPEAPGLVDADGHETSLLRIFKPQMHTIMVFTLSNGVEDENAIAVVKAAQTYILHEARILLLDVN